MHKPLLRLIVLSSLSVLLLNAVFAQQPPTTRLYVTLSTRTMQMPVIPGLPAGMEIPGMGANAASRSVSGRAVYDAKPVAPIFVTVPADLKLPNNRLLLHLPGTAPAAAGDDTEDTPEQPERPANMEITTKLYWHPDEAKGPLTETIKIENGKLVAGDMNTINLPGFDLVGAEEPANEARGEESKLPATVRGQGNYVCNTGGTASLDGFLPPLKVTEPDMNTVDTKAGFTLKWDPVPGARGYLISITAMASEGDDENGKMTTTSWYSTLVEPPMRLRAGYHKDTTIADDLRDGLLLPGETTSCRVPAGIFETYNFMTVMVEAIGNDFYSNAGPTVFGLIRSEWTATKMNLGAMEDEEEEE